MYEPLVYMYNGEVHLKSGGISEQAWNVPWGIISSGHTWFINNNLCLIVTPAKSNL